MSKKLACLQVMGKGKQGVQSVRWGGLLQPGRRMRQRWWGGDLGLWTSLTASTSQGNLAVAKGETELLIYTRSLYPVKGVTQEVCMTPLPGKTPLPVSRNANTTEPKTSLGDVISFI